MHFFAEILYQKNCGSRILWIFFRSAKCLLRNRHIPTQTNKSLDTHINHWIFFTFLYTNSPNQASVVLLGPFRDLRWWPSKLPPVSPLAHSEKYFFFHNLPQESMKKFHAYNISAMKLKLLHYIHTNFFDLILVQIYFDKL